MTSPRDVLNRIKWESPDRSLDGVLVQVLHRGAPNDTAYIKGKTILEVGRSFLDLPEGVRIPHHRIRAIEKDGQVVWRRRSTTTLYAERRNT